MASEDLLSKVRRFPKSPGVYLFKDRDGKVVYVGKARVLRSRVASYFQSSPSRDAGTAVKVARIRAEVADADFVATENEVEALLLENELIKKLQPKFNFQLRDDKSFPFVMITNERYPRVLLIRGPHLYPQENRFFGPFVNKKALVRALKVLRKIFPHCTCKVPTSRRKGRPCLAKQLELCPAPCAGGVDPEDYRRNVESVAGFLEGRGGEVVAKLEGDMARAVERLEFERAAVLRDQLAAVRSSLRGQAVVSDEGRDQDILGVHQTDVQAVVVVLLVREGKLVDKHSHVLDLGPVEEPWTPERVSDLLGAFVRQYYLNERNYLPEEVVLPEPVEDLDVVAEAIAKQRHPVELRVAEPGSNEWHLVKIARKNAKLVLGQSSRAGDGAEGKLEQTFAGLMGLVPDLEAPPRRVEAFDVSNLQGGEATASMVCFVDGEPSKADYRRFKIRGKDTPDDYAMMKEVVTRRYSRLLRERKRLPDLVLVDGGKGQLNVALEALAELGVDRLPVVGLAKSREEVFVKGRSDPVDLAPDSAASLFLQRIRDEAHRFAVAYHKKLRKKARLASPLDAVKGVGPVTRRKLLVAFGSLDGVRLATIDQLEKVVGKKLAARVHEALHSESGRDSGDHE
ncbi:MAG: excinuclease ABC subunit UvrC [Promethearchaeota archaeon]